MRELAPVFQHRRMRLALAVVALAIVAAAAWWLPRTGKRANAFLATPQLALESLPAAPLYFNGPARPWLLLLRPDLLLPEDRDVRSERSRAFAQAVLDPKLFRQLDRRSRFETVLFVGDPSQFHTLLDHLASTKDFTLSYVDHTSLVFKRSSAEPWSLEKFAGVRSRLGGMSSRERAQVLALTAAKLIAARRETDAKTLLDEAFALDANCADAWTALASYRLTRGDGNGAIEASDRALKIEPQHLGALAMKTHVLYATKHFSEAFALSERLIARLPEDPNALFKHAQIAHEAHAYKTEITALEKLIALAESEQRSTTGYRLYLAQAYTAAGDGQRALENFQRVLADPELPEDQRKFASESIERIKSRTGL